MVSARSAVKAVSLLFSFGVLLGDGLSSRAGTGLGGVRPVGAVVMPAKDCAHVTLLGTEMGLAETPRADTSTEAVAVGIDREIVAFQVRKRLCMVSCVLPVCCCVILPTLIK